METSKPSFTNCPFAFLNPVFLKPGNILSSIFVKYLYINIRAEVVSSTTGNSQNNNGGYSAGVHLFPFRTEKLSPVAPMVLLSKAGE